MRVKTFHIKFDEVENKIRDWVIEENRERNKYISPELLMKYSRDIKILNVAQSTDKDYLYITIFYK